VTRKELLDAALKAVGGNEAELAQRLGIKNVNSAATEFNRYRRGESMKFERTLALLQIAGLLREESTATPQPEVSLTPLEAELLDRFQVALNDLAEGVAEVRRRVQDQDAQLEGLESALRRRGQL
jgi:hypothetical protein